MKTNKAYKKRVKITKKGKVLIRTQGQDHYNAKEGGESQFNKAGYRVAKWSNRIKRRFLSGIK